MLENVHEITREKEHAVARRGLQEQLVQAQKMESIGRLAGGVAHDFNNLLTSIIGNADLALATLPPDSPAHEDLLEVNKAADRAASLTRQLLAFSRRQVFEPRLVDAQRRHHATWTGCCAG